MTCLRLSRMAVATNLNIHMGGVRQRVERGDGSSDEVKGGWTEVARERMRHGLDPECTGSTREGSKVMPGFESELQEVNRI